MPNEKMVISTGVSHPSVWSKGTALGRYQYGYERVEFSTIEVSGLTSVFTYFKDMEATCLLTLLEM